ncbi:death-associated protein kinase [Pontoporia blainvillei]|uniref:Death-associated protein kinase n=1 Tax=Pontoporia blainvillei TaxID=48723 RepID=A0ABX0S7Z3_PONBL|nr:death-associated protein kinase [Pontoporia blainvillei]
MNIPRPAGGEFGYDKDTSLLKEVRNRFGNDLHISHKLFVLDAGASGSKDMKVLRNHLQEIRSQIVSAGTLRQSQWAGGKPGGPWRAWSRKPVGGDREQWSVTGTAPAHQVCPPMTHLCEKIISTLPSWRKLNGPNQLMSLQQFVYDVQDQLNPLASEADLRRIAQQLHSAGELMLSCDSCSLQDGCSPWSVSAPNRPLGLTDNQELVVTYLQGENMWRH